MKYIYYFTILLLAFSVTLLAFLWLGDGMCNLKYLIIESSPSSGIEEGFEEVEGKPLSDNTSALPEISGGALRELNTQEIKDYIVEAANKYGVDSDLALRIAECESQFRNVCNTGGCQYGIGVFQIVQSTFDEAIERMIEDNEMPWVWCGGSDCDNLSEREAIDKYYPIKNPKLNIDVAIWLMSKGEYWRWNPSKSCWKY